MKWHIYPISRVIFLLAACVFLAFVGCSAENNKGGGTAHPGTGSSGTGASSGGGGSDAKAGGGAYGGGVGAYGGGSSGSGGSKVSRPASADACAEVNVQISRTTPWVMFVVDRSGSTGLAYPGSACRWEALYDALMDPNVGVIPKLQSSVYMGITLYDGGEDTDPAQAPMIALFDPNVCTGGYINAVVDGGAIAPCPRLITVDPALNNYSAISAVYNYPNAHPGGMTPTAKALHEAYTRMDASAKSVLDLPAPPSQTLILCTDGEPNDCGGWVMVFNVDTQGPINEVTAAANMGVKTYVVGVAVNQQAQDILDQLAQIGNTGATTAFSPTTKDELVKTLTDIVGGQVLCTVELQGKVKVGKECLGTVSLNSAPLECNGADGWKLVDESHIELTGAACQSLQGDSTAMLSGTFPCDVIVLQ